MTARCCVLIPDFEAGERLSRSLGSIDGLREGAADALVVDDGSSRVPARDALATHPIDGRVQIIEIPENVGIARALNAGLMPLLDLYEYVARLDCGDLRLGNRVAAQMAFLDANHDCVMVGSWGSFHRPDGKDLYTVRHPTDHESILRAMHVNNAFIHSAVMFRSATLRQVGPYPCDREAAEDHAYFFDIAARHRVANLPEIHVRCLLDPDGISNRSRRRQIRSRIKVLLDHFDWRPISIYGLARALAQLGTPRSSTVIVRTILRSRDHLSVENPHH